MSTIDSENIFKVKLAIDVQPKISIDRTRGIIKYGKNNSHPAQLLFWINNHAEHGAIVKGKARYVAGITVKQKGESNPTVEAFLNHANKKESWHDVIKKLSFDKAASGGYFVKAETNAIGTPIEYEHFNFAKARFSDCGEYVGYCFDWEDSMYNRTPVFLPIWKPGIIGTCIFVYKNYSAGAGKYDGVYSRPEYEDCTLDIDTDVRLSTFFNSLIRNNFSAGTLVNIKNGEVPKEKKQDISNRLQKDHSGEDEAGTTVILYTAKDSGPTEVLTLNANDLDKQYQEVGKRNQQKILSGHGVNGVLFKIKTEGQLGSRSEIVEAHELFINEYVKPEQEIILKDLKRFCKLTTGIDTDFEFEQVKPIGLELPLENQNVVDALNAKDPNIILNYLIEKYAIKIPETLDVNGVPVTTTANINDGLKGLSAAENADVIRIVRDFQKGRNGMNEAMALSRIMAYGVTQQEAKKWLGLPPDQVQQSSKRNEIFFSLLSKYAHDINFDDEILDVQEVKFKSFTEALQFEKVKFAETKVSKDIQDSVLNQLKGNTEAKESDIAKSLGIELALVTAAITALVAGGYLVSKTDFTPTEKGRNKPTESTEIYTEYVYDLKQSGLYAGRKNIMPGSKGKLLMSSHQFCKDMIMDYPNKAWSFEAIMSMTNEFGENAWDYAGGFTTQPNGDVDVICNHRWKAVTKVRRTSKNA